MQTPARTLSADLDDNGRFVIDPAPHGLVKFVFHQADAQGPVTTPSVEI